MLRTLIEYKCLVRIQDTSETKKPKQASIFKQVAKLATSKVVAKRSGKKSEESLDKQLLQIESSFHEDDSI